MIELYCCEEYTESRQTSIASAIEELVRKKGKPDKTLKETLVYFLPITVYVFEEKKLDDNDIKSLARMAAIHVEEEVMHQYDYRFETDESHIEEDKKLWALVPMIRDLISYIHVFSGSSDREITYTTMDQMEKIFDLLKEDASNDG